MRTDTGRGGLAAVIGRGLVAGAVGTAAMTVSSTLEQRKRGRPPSTAPADAAAEVLGIESFRDDAAKRRFSSVVHWSYGTGWGIARAALRAAGLGAAGATVVHLAAVWGGQLVMLPALGVAPPPWDWGVDEVAIDAGHHVVYALAAGAAFEALSA
jgi:hypothetical protein